MRDVLVWLVDDVPSVRKSIRAVLESTDITVRDYASAREFLADYQAGARGCLVVDQHMPDMNGIDLLKHLVDCHMAPPTIVITGQGSSALRMKALQAGAIAMMDKPVDGVELIDLIKATLAAA